MCHTYKQCVVMSLKESVGKTFRTVSEMILDRNILDDAEKDILAHFSKNEIDALASKKTFQIDIGKKVRIIYFLEKFRVPELKPFVADPFDLYIVILSEKLTSFNHKGIAELESNANTKSTPLKIQMFELKEVMFNITKHVLVPKHEVVDDEVAIDAIVKQYNVRSKHYFPILLKTDPIARYYGIKSGSLVRVTRVSPSSGEYVVYRCCV
jgi:DNA-directed RNA polymerase subunit H (RpoH/RPB5)